jgi:hypothetical protein
MPGTKTDPTLIWVCTDCMLGQEGYDEHEMGRPFEREPMGEIPEGFDLTAGMLRKEHAQGCPNRKKKTAGVEQCDCERIEHSTRSCDGCGQHLHGTRHAYTMWTEPEPELHAHFASDATDCDGRITRDWVVTMTKKERTGEFGDIHFHDRIVADVVNTYSLMRTGALTVVKFEDGSVRLTWGEPTDEGGRQVEATICRDACDTGEKSYRDHRAESMGY